MAGEYLAIGHDDRLDQAAAGLERRELLEVLPHTDVLAVGAGVEQLPGGGQGVDVALLANQRPDEGVLGHGAAGIVLDSRGGPASRLVERGRGCLVPRGHHHRGALPAQPGLVVEARAGRRHAAVAIGEVVVGRDDQRRHVRVGVHHVVAVLRPGNAAVLGEHGAASSSLLVSHLSRSLSHQPARLGKIGKTERAFRARKVKNIFWNKMFDGWDHTEEME